MNVTRKAILTFSLLIMISAVTVSPVAAHGEGDADLWHHWAWQDLPLLLLVGGTYALGVSSLWKRAGVGSGISRAQAAAFGIGLIVLFLALVSPLDFLSEELLSAHMVQHLLLMLAAAPLFVIGRFPLALTWAIPAPWTTRIWNHFGWKQTWKFLTRPVTACLLHATLVWFWHMPQPYESSLRNEWLHFFEHMSFFLSALLFWQVFAELSENMGINRSANFGMGIFYLFAIMMLNGFLGVLLAFSSYAWYPIYIHKTAAYGLTALGDQQLAGTIMWVPAGVIYLAAAIGILSRWLFAMEAAENPQA